MRLCKFNVFHCGIPEIFQHDPRGVPKADRVTVSPGVFLLPLSSNHSSRGVAVGGGVAGFRSRTDGSSRSVTAGGDVAVCRLRADGSPRGVAAGGDVARKRAGGGADQKNGDELFDEHD